MSYNKIFFILTSIGSLIFASVSAKSPDPAPMAPTQTETPATPAPSTPVTPPSSTDHPSLPSLDTQTSTESYEHAFVKMLATLVGLLLLVFLTVWFLRRLTQGRIGAFGSNKQIKIIERRPLSPKSILYLIEVGSKQVLVAESQLEIKALTTISQFPEDEES